MKRSSFVKTEKPGKAIYQIALTRMETIKEKSIFIDDKMENIDGAEQAGIKGIHLDRNKGDLLELLREENLI